MIEIKYETVTTKRESWSIEAPFGSSVHSHELRELIEAAEAGARTEFGFFDSEPLPLGAVTVSFRDGVYTASYEVKQ